MRALVSVSDKTGIVDFSRALVELGWEIVSTGGTLRELQAGGVPAVSVSDITGFPEILDGRVKTLHPAVHGGLLARRDAPEHREQMAEHQITPIDMLIVNLYPFEQTVRQAGISLDEAIEQIDIGGPAMIRAGAKNFEHVIVITDPGDQEWLLDRLRAGSVTNEERRRLAAKAFQHTAVYDTIVSQYLRGTDEQFPAEWSVAGRRAIGLRYGENPHQAAAAYHRLEPGKTSSGILAARQIHGKELSYNNLLDADAALGAVQGWDSSAVAIVKHTIPCGLATRPSLDEAYREALVGDPVSAFGGIVACNRVVEPGLAEELTRTFYEIIIAPGFDDEALAVLRAKKNLRLLEIRQEDLSASNAISVRSIQGGLLVQQPDVTGDEPSEWRVVTKRSPSPDEFRDLRFAWRAARHVKSNAIVIASDEAIVGVGAGQPNRLESVAIALKRAGDRSHGAVLASDAFFPFPDGVELALRGGVSAIIQPGGSIRDSAVIDAVDAAGGAMVFTGTRHFLH